MSNLFDESTLAWQVVRPDVATDVFGRTLQEGKVKVVLTRVAPGGKFRAHRDAYAHLFYFLSGTGIVEVGEQKREARVGVVVQIEAGEAHAYENTGTDDLVLISMNLPSEK